MPVSINNTTLTFNDATTQTTSGVTSVGAGTGISSSGGKTPTITNTGVTSVSGGTGISVSASTGGVTITNTQPGAVSSVNGQTGAVVNTNFDSIGSVGWFAQTTTSNIFPGSTVAGSNLYYANTITGTQGETRFFTQSNQTNVFPWNYYEISQCYTRISIGNTGFQAPLGSSSPGGTWRAMSTVRARSGGYDGESNSTSSNGSMTLFVRVS